MKAIHAFFFLVFCLVCIPNHYFLRSASLDYGLANQAIHLIAHGKTPIVTQLLGQHQEYHYLGLHVSLWVYVFAPFYYLGGSYTLLILQCLALVFGAIGIQKLSALLGSEQHKTLLVIGAYYCFFGLYTALSVEYHDNVIGATFLPWLFLGLKKKQWTMAWISVLAILISKENMSLYVIGIGMGLFFLKDFRSAPYYKFATALVTSGIVWFLFCAWVLMPYFNTAGKFEQLNRFSHLGGNLGQILTHVISHPINMLGMFFFSHVQPDAEEIIKQEFLLALLVSGAWALVFKPQFLLMALPLLAQKLWNKETVFWGVNHHYQAEFAALIAIAFLFWVDPKSKRQQNLLAMIYLVGAMLTSVYLMYERKATLDKVKENIFFAEHYTANKQVPLIKQELSKLKDIGSASVQTNLLPHFYDIPKPYHFPYHLQAEAIVLTKYQRQTYPLQADSADALLQSLLQSKEWKIDSSFEYLLVLKRQP